MSVSVGYRSLKSVLATCSNTACVAVRVCRHVGGEQDPGSSTRGCLHTRVVASTYVLARVVACTGHARIQQACGGKACGGKAYGRQEHVVHIVCTSMCTWHNTAQWCRSVASLCAPPTAVGREGGRGGPREGVLLPGSRTVSRSCITLGPPRRFCTTEHKRTRQCVGEGVSKGAGESENRG